LVKILGPAPSNNADAVTKSYVDALAVGIDWKNSVRVATTSAGTLSSSFANGQTIDGVTIATGDRILIKDQSAGSENGIYVVAASGAPTRASDANTSSNVTSNLAVFVEEGTSNADTGWVLTNNGSITIGTTALSFTQFSGSGASAGTGLSQSGNTISIENSGVLTVAHGGTGAATLTGIIKGNGTSALTAVTAPSGAIVGTTDSQILTGKTIDLASASNTIKIAGNALSGTPSSSNYLRGDGVWSSASNETVTTSSATTLTLTTSSSAYVYTGSSAATWTLPAISGNTGLRFNFKNRGTATLTVQRAGTDQIYVESAINTLILGPGASGQVLNDGTYWVATSTTAVTDANFWFQDDSDTSKQLQFQLSGISTGTTRTLTVPDADTTIVGTDASQILTSKTLANPTVTNYVETNYGIGTVTTSYTIDLTNGTIQSCTLTASTACTFTMPANTAGKSFVLIVTQAASTGDGTATFTGVKWSGGNAPTMSAAAGKIDLYTFFADGTNWYGSFSQNY
jgi:hypothetical protein